MKPSTPLRAGRSNLKEKDKLTGSFDFTVIYAGVVVAAFAAGGIAATIAAVKLGGRAVKGVWRALT